MTAKTELKLDFIFNCSPAVLFKRLSTASGIGEWFADKVIVEDNLYTFEWDRSSQQAILLEMEKDQHIRFQWLEDKGTDAYFQFDISQTELTKELALTITEYVDESDIEFQTDLWEQQIKKLKRVLGA